MLYGDVAGWLAGCLSVTAGIVSKRLKPTLKIFFNSLIAPSFKFLWPLAPFLNSKWNPFNGGVKYTEWENLAIFDANRRLSRKRCEIGRWLLCNINRKSWVPDWMISSSMTLSDLWPRFQGHDIFWHWISQKGHEREPSYYRTSIGSRMRSIERWHF